MVSSWRHTDVSKGHVFSGLSLSVDPANSQLYLLSLSGSLHKSLKENRSRWDTQVVTKVTRQTHPSQHCPAPPSVHMQCSAKHLEPASASRATISKQKRLSSKRTAVQKRKFRRKFVSIEQFFFLNSLHKMVANIEKIVHGWNNSGLTLEHYIGL